MSGKDFGIGVEKFYWVIDGGTLKPFDMYSEAVAHGGPIIGGFRCSENTAKFIASNGNTFDKAGVKTVLAW